MTGPKEQAHAQVMEQWIAGRKPTYYVFWKTDSAYGSRGNGMSREAAEELAQRIRVYGPNAPVSDLPLPWVNLNG